MVYEAFQGGQAKIQLQAFPFRMTTANFVGATNKIPMRRFGKCSRLGAMRSWRPGTHRRLPSVMSATYSIR